jgi:aryl-alcohol dehydrogenase-like predicted oxidoreductase
MGDFRLILSKIGFGTGYVGRPNRGQKWSSVDTVNFRDALAEARELGVNWIDTAPLYGFGFAEQLIGKNDWNLLISSKCGKIWDQQYRVKTDLTYIRQECEDSLRRLKTSVIHLYQIHWPGNKPGETDQNFEEAWATMANLKAEGKVVSIGGSNFTLDNIKQAQGIAPVDFVQLPYNPLRKDIENDILPYCKQQGIWAVTYSPLQSGLFSGHINREKLSKLPENDWRLRNEYFQEPLLTQALELVAYFSILGEIYKPYVSPATMAIAWNLWNESVAATIIGFRNLNQVVDMIWEIQRVIGPISPSIPLVSPTSPSRLYRRQSLSEIP